MVTKQEKKLMDMLWEKEHDRDWMIAVTCYGRQKNATDAIIQYIETHPRAYKDDILGFALLYGRDDLE